MLHPKVSLRRRVISAGVRLASMFAMLYMLQAHRSLGVWLIVGTMGCTGCWIASYVW